MVTRTKLILQDLSLVAIWNFEKQIWDFPDNKMLHITKMATTCIKKKKKKSLILALFWYFVWPRKALSGPILVPFIILSDPRKEKQKLFSLHHSKTRRRKKRLKKAKVTERGEKRAKERQLVATALDWSLCLGSGHWAQNAQLPTFYAQIFPWFHPCCYLGQKFDPK